MLPFVLECDEPKEASLSSSWDAFNLPKDVLIDILKRLPLKSLIRLTSVSKSWLSLITWPSLISSHVSHNLSINGEPKDHVFKETFYEQVVSSNTYFFILDRYLLYNRDRINCPVGKNHFIVASSHGLFCLFDFHSEYPQIEPLILWNPSIRKTLIVLPPHADADADAAFVNNKLIFGFGYDSLSSTYKLIRVAYAYLATGTFFKTQIYDLHHKKWRSLDVASMSFTVSSVKGRGLYMNGVIHWVCNLNASVCCSILTFNMGSEGFGEIELPKEVGEAINQTVKVVMVPKSSKEVFGVIHHTASLELNVWVMEQYGVKESWVKLFNTETESMIMNDINVAVLNDELVIYQLSSYAWISYNVRTKETRNITHWFLGRDYVDTYVESLLLLR